jgi:hypothetical protein
LQEVVGYRGYNAKGTGNGKGSGKVIFFIKVVQKQGLGGNGKRGQEGSHKEAHNQQKENPSFFAFLQIKDSA